MQASVILKVYEGIIKIMKKIWAIFERKSFENILQTQVITTQ